MPAKHPELEITETRLASDIDYALDTLKRLNEVGVQLSIDDFGTGYSSLSQLKHFPVDRVKIDQSSIKNVTEDFHDAAITSAVIAMAKSMKIQVLAEGVETLEHLEFLWENGCNEVQGYFLSKLKSAEKVVEEMPALHQKLIELFQQEISSGFKRAG